jgi:hypothetical protein
LPLGLRVDVLSWDSNLTTVFLLKWIYRIIIYNVMYNRIAFLVVAAILLTAIVSVGLFNPKAANAQSKHIIIMVKPSNMTGSTSQNQTGMMMGTNATGSIPIGPTIANAIASQIVCTVGPSAHTAAARIGTVHGFLVYMTLVYDMNTRTFHGVLVDPGNGKASTPIPFGAMGMMMGSGNMMGMMGPGMMEGNGMMGPGMMGGHP